MSYHFNSSLEHGAKDLGWAGNMEIEEYIRQVCSSFHELMNLESISMPDDMNVVLKLLCCNSCLQVEVGNSLIPSAAFQCYCVILRTISRMNESILLFCTDSRSAEG